MLAYPLLLLRVEGKRGVAVFERRLPPPFDARLSTPDLGAMTRARARLEDDVDRQWVRFAACLPACRGRGWWLAIAFVVLVGAKLAPSAAGARRTSLRTSDCASRTELEAARA